MTRLWDKGERLDDVIERFTVGRDPELDLLLLPFDVLGSAAHARMLESVGLITSDELEGLLAELSSIAREARAGEFIIERSEEDCHTAIENRLTERVGEAGKRIHTARSRNDQVIAAIRLYAREAILGLSSQVIDLAGVLIELAEKHRDVSVPGYTHTRQAMPSTLGALFGAYAEGLVDDLPWLSVAFAHVNRSPLGSASGFGVPLPIDRQLVAQLLRFDSVQQSVIAVQNDRGKTEHLVATAAATPALDLGRLAVDLIWYSSDELGYLSLARHVTTGSSIMPQKRNPDALELTRATCAKLRARTLEISSISGPLSSGYHRDLQLTKEPFLAVMEGARDVLVVMKTVLETLEVHPEVCHAAAHPAIAATDAMCAKIRDGVPMRQAYREIGRDPSAAYSGDPAEAWRERTHLGAPGALDFSSLRGRLKEQRGVLAERRAQIEGAWSELIGPAQK